MDFSINIKGHELEYFDDEHIYLVDGILVPSITTIMKVRFGGKYSTVDRETLERARNHGTEVHEVIQNYYEHGIKANIDELRDMQFLERTYGFDVIETETPVILFKDDKPISAGRIDLVLATDDAIGGADIKTTSALDKEYLFYQLNLYRIAYEQTYGVKWTFLKGIHLKPPKRKYVDIPINEELAWGIVKEWEETNE